MHHERAGARGTTLLVAGFSTATNSVVRRDNVMLTLSSRSIITRSRRSSRTSRCFLGIQHIQSLANLRSSLDDLPHETCFSASIASWAR